MNYYNIYIYIFILYSNSQVSLCTFIVCNLYYYIIIIIIYWQTLSIIFIPKRMPIDCQLNQNIIV